MNWWVIIPIFCASFITYFIMLITYGQKITRIDYYEDLDQTIYDKEQQLQQIAAECKDKSEEKEKLSIEIESLKRTIIDGMKQFEIDQKEILDSKVKLLNEQAKHQAELAAREFEKMSQNFEAIKKSKEEEYKRKVEEVGALTDDFKKHHSALIEVFKREEEEKEAQYYRTLQLNESDISDILVIEDVLSQLRNKDVISKLVWTVYIQPQYTELMKRLGVDDSTSGIYKIVNQSNMKAYIGKSVRVKARFAEHLKNALSDTPTQEIHKEMKNYGVWNYTFELLEQCDKNKLSEREKYYIDLFDTNNYGLNRSAGG